MIERKHTFNLEPGDDSDAIFPVGQFTEHLLSARSPRAGNLAEQGAVVAVDRNVELGAGTISVGEDSSSVDRLDRKQLLEARMQVLCESS